MVQYVTHTSRYTVLLQKKVKSCLPCPQSRLFLLILFSDCISLSRRLPCYSSSSRFQNLWHKAVHWQKINQHNCNFLRLELALLNIFHCILGIDYGWQPMSCKLLQILLLMALYSCSSLHLHEENRWRFHQL